MGKTHRAASGNETPSKMLRRLTGEVQALFEVDSQGGIVLTAPVAHLARLAAHADLVVAARAQASTLEHASERAAAAYTKEILCE